MERLELLGDDQWGGNLGLGETRIEVVGPGLKVDEEIRRCLPEHLMHRFRCLPMHVEGNLLFVAMADPTDRVALEDLRLITGFDIEPVATDAHAIEAALRGQPLRVHQNGPIHSPFPLQECRVEAHLSGPLASVDVVQRFANRLNEPMEACYVFPLPAGAAVHSFRMLVGSRVVEGVVQARGRARQTYAEGKAQGHRVALLEQSRDNVVTAQLGNLPPGEQVTIELSYVERVEQNLCESIFRFPLVVAPRHPSGSSDSLSIPREAHDARLELALTLDVPAGAPVCHLACSQHAVACTQAEGTLRVELARNDELLNRDFVLRYSFQGDQLQPSLLVDDEHFLLTVMPPRDCELPPVRRDVQFVIDRSGSMEGLKWLSAVQATLDFVATLDAGDTFRLIAFDDRNEVFEGGTVAAARKWLGQLQPRGGTDILCGLREAACLPAAEGRQQCIVLITDGQVGNEQEVYAEVQSWPAGRRLFTLGIDSAVHDGFLKEVARLGSGTCELVTPGEKLEGALARLARATGSPLVTDVRLLDRGLNFLEDSLNPRPLPDLFPSRPICVSGRKLGHGRLEVVGRLASGETWSTLVEPSRSSNPALGLLWARERIRVLEHERGGAEQLEGLALRYRLLSSRTSFVLVDRAATANPGGVTVPVVQPVEVPELWGCAETVKDISAQDFGPLEFEDDSDQEIALDKLREMMDEAPIVRVVNLILSQAINDGATHIHLQAAPKSLEVLYRVDGVLHDVMSPPKHIEAPMFARLRSMAGAALDQTEGEGGFSLMHDGKDYQIHVRWRPGKTVVTIRGDRPVALRAFLPPLLARAGLVAIAGTGAELLEDVARHLNATRDAAAVRGWDVDALVAERYCEALLEVRCGAFGVPAPDVATALAWIRRHPELEGRVTAVVAVQRPRRKCPCPSGCDTCKMTGYRGTLEFVEWLEMQSPEKVHTPFGAQGEEAMRSGLTSADELARVLPYWQCEALPAR